MVMISRLKHIYKIDSTMGPGIDNLISVTSVNKNGKSKTSYAVSDALGSIRSIVGENGQELNRYEYTPFGVAYKAVEGVKQPYRFTGRRWDENVGRQWSRTRHYDPARGRFAAADKWIAAKLDEINKPLYRFVANSPLTFVDPYGFAEEMINLIFSVSDFQNKVGTKIQEKCSAARGVKSEVYYDYSGQNVLDKILEVATQGKKIQNLFLFGHSAYRPSDPDWDESFETRIFTEIALSERADDEPNASERLSEELLTQFTYSNLITLKNAFTPNSNIYVVACGVGRAQSFMQTMANWLPLGLPPGTGRLKTYLDPVNPMTMEGASPVEFTNELRF